MNLIRRNIPNAITCLNVLSGTLAILAALHGEQTWGGLTGLQWAWVLIGIAAVADFCDGMAARALKAYSNMGRELDSLCDLVSFGVAPVVIMHQSLVTYICCSGSMWLAWLTPLIAVCGALRLARFNVAPEDNNYFTGLPIPANALFWIGFSAQTTGQTWLCMPDWFVACVLIVMPLLMVSPLKFCTFKIKFHTSGTAPNPEARKLRWMRLTVIAIAIACCCIWGLGGMALAMYGYVGVAVLAALL